jgi:hypothetical protein
MAAQVRLATDEARPLGSAGRGFFVGSYAAGN